MEHRQINERQYSIIRAMAFGAMQEHCSIGEEPVPYQATYLLTQSGAILAYSIRSAHSNQYFVSDMGEMLLGETQQKSEPRMPHVRGFGQFQQVREGLESQA